MLRSVCFVSKSASTIGVGSSSYGPAVPDNWFISSRCVQAYRLILYYTLTSEAGLYISELAL